MLSLLRVIVASTILLLMCPCNIKNELMCNTASAFALHVKHSSSHRHFSPQPHTSFYIQHQTSLLRVPLMTRLQIHPHPHFHAAGRHDLQRNRHAANSGNAQRTPQTSNRKPQTASHKLIQQHPPQAFGHNPLTLNTKP